MKGKYIMCKLLNTSDYKVLPENQILNLKFLQNDLKKKDYLKYLLFKIQMGIRLQDLRLHAGFRKFFINSPRIDRIHPP